MVHCVVEMKFALRIFADQSLVSRQTERHSEKIMKIMKYNSSVTFCEKKIQQLINFSRQMVLAALYYFVQTSYCMLLHFRKIIGLTTHLKTHTTQFPHSFKAQFQGLVRVNNSRTVNGISLTNVHCESKTSHLTLARTFATC